MGPIKDEIIEALQFVGLSNVHSMSTALPVVVQEFEAFKKAHQPRSDRDIAT